jgi:hypothetical protein
MRWVAWKTLAERSLNDVVWAEGWRWTHDEEAHRKSRKCHVHVTPKGPSWRRGRADAADDDLSCGAEVEFSPPFTHEIRCGGH